MINFLNKTKDRLQVFAVKAAKSRYAKVWLSVVAFAESSFFPLPPDVVLIYLMLVEKGKQWFYHGLLTTFFSVLGGLFGYLIGYGLFELVGQPIIDFYSLEEEVKIVADAFNQNAFLAIFIASFTPIPYKVFTISAGLFSVNLFIFFLASVIGRGLRFLIIAFLLKLYGRQISDFIYRYFNLLTLLAGAILILLVFLSM